MVFDNYKIVKFPEKRLKNCNSQKNNNYCLKNIRFNK